MHRFIYLVLRALNPEVFFYQGNAMAEKNQPSLSFSNEHTSNTFSL